MPLSQIPGATSSGQICYELIATATRLYAACGKTPNFTGAFRVDNGDEGTRTWQYSTGGNVQTLALIPGTNDLVIGGHFGINSSSRYNGRMRCGPSTGPATWIRAIAIIRNVASTTSFVSPRTDGGDLGHGPVGRLQLAAEHRRSGPALADPDANMPGVNRYGGMWELQVTNDPPVGARRVPLRQHAGPSRDRPLPLDRRPHAPAGPGAARAHRARRRPRR